MYEAVIMEGLDNSHELVDYVAFGRKALPYLGLNLPGQIGLPLFLDNIYLEHLLFVAD